MSNGHNEICPGCAALKNTHSHFLCIMRVLWSKVATKTKLLREKLQRGYSKLRKARLEESGAAHTALR